MEKSKTGKLIAVAAVAGAGYFIYKAMTASAASDSGMPQGSLGGSDSLLGDQGFNLDPNSPVPYPVNPYIDPNTGLPYQFPDTTPTPNATPDTYTSPDGTKTSAAAGTDWGNLALQAAIFGAGSYAAEKGAKSLYDKFKTNKQLKAEEKLRAEGKTATEAEKINTADQIKTEAKFKEGDTIKMRDSMEKIDTMPKADRVKFGEEFKLSSEKVQIKAEEGGFGKAAGNAAEILFLAQVGSSIVQSGKDRAASGESFWGKGNAWDRISEVGSQPVIVEGLGKAGQGVVGFVSGLVYTPEALNKYGYSDMETPSGWFVSEKGIISGIGQIGSSFKNQGAGAGTVTTIDFLGLGGFVPSSWQPSSSGSSATTVTKLTAAQQTASNNLMSAMGISTQNPFTSSATYDTSTGTFTSSSGVKSSMASAPAGATIISSSGSSSSSSSSSKSTPATTTNIFGMTVAANPFTSSSSSSSSSSSKSSSQNMSVAPKSTTPTTIVSQNATAAKTTPVQTVPKTNNVVANVTNSVKSAVSSVVSSISSFFGGGKKK